MILIDQIKEGLSIMLHPTTASYKKRSIKEMLLFYYEFSLIPLILYMVFSFLNPSPLLYALNGILSLWIFAPIGFFITALIYQAIGKVFRVFKNPFESTFDAAVYGIIPSVLFVWLQPIPIVKLLFIIFEIWAFIVFVFALARMQNIRPLASFGIILATVIIVLIIAGIIVMDIGISHLSTILNSSLNATKINSTTIK